MKLRLTLLTFLVSVTALITIAQQPEFDWVFQCGNPSNTTDTKTTLAANPDGGFYLAGEFLDNVQFGEKITISFKQIEPGRLEVLDLAGRIAYTSRVTGRTVIDLAGLPAGRYILNYTNNQNGRQTSRSFVKY